MLNGKAIEPIGSAKHPVDIWNGIAQQIPQIAHRFIYSAEDYMNMRLAPVTPHMQTMDPSITLERLREEA